LKKRTKKAFFAPLRAVLNEPATKINKVFLLLFVHKKKSFLQSKKGVDGRFRGHDGSKALIENFQKFLRSFF